MHAVIVVLMPAQFICVTSVDATCMDFVVEGLVKKDTVKCADARSATTKTFKLAQKARTLFALHIIVVCCLMRSVREVNMYHVFINKSTALFIPSEFFENGRDHTLCVASHLSCICVWADKPFANLINKKHTKISKGRLRLD